MDNNYREKFFSTKGEECYETVLDKVQKIISKHLDGNVDTVDEKDFKEKIEKCITDYDIKCNITDSVTELANHLYHDMAGYSFISRNNLLEIEGFEELDVNSWEDVDIIIYGQAYKTDYQFISPQHATDIHKRLLRKTNTVLDDAMPQAIADLGPNIRIAVMKTPLVDENVGIVSSIRKVDSRQATKETFIGKTLTDDMLSFLELVSQNGVSMCFAGETGAGKTYLGGYILGQAAKKLRTFTIEEGSREWNFVARDGKSKICNSVIHTKTRSSDDAALHISQDKLLTISLRFNPSVIGIGEMRSIEAYTAAEAGRTGHCVISTTHSGSAVDTAYRIFELAKKAHDFNDNLLLNMIVKAFPIIVYVEKLADKVRRATEIIELTGVTAGVVEYRTLWTYQVKENKYTEVTDKKTGFTGIKVETIGSFVQKDNMSDELAQRILKKGATSEELARFTKKTAKRRKTSDL